MTAPHNGTGNGLAPAGAVPWAQQAGRQQERKTSRTRQMVRNLPSWDRRD
jgi:hypothetical protein